ncbi:MAG: hypothetical protein HKN34_08325 [Gammaproteobacteria bacterium]|nr:hypothetical protein [Gammaproteobacteria bacterium]
MDLKIMSGLRQHVGRMSIDQSESSDSIEHEMSDLLHNRLDQQAAAELRERVRQNPAMLREALHFARHHVAMQKNVQEPREPKTKVFWWREVANLIRQSLQFETDVWKMIPVAVVLLAVATVFVDQQRRQPSQLTRLIEFDSNSSMQFFAQQSQPGIGFFANTRQTSIPFEGVSVTINNDEEIAFSWPAIENAQSYQLKLQVFRNAEAVVLGRYAGKEPGAVIKLSEPAGRHRYEWVLSGDTIDKRSFQTTGGFVIAQ